jgi:hypothetical protein
MEMWVDGSVIEMFVDGREALTMRSFVGSGEIEVTGEGLESLSVSGVKAISKDRLTS